MISAEQIAKELAEIQSRVPIRLKQMVVREVPASPTIKKVMLIALKSKKISDEKKKQIQALMDAGEFDKKKFIEDPKIAKMIDNFVGREINKKIKLGLLPPKGQIKDLSHVKELYEKVHNQKH